MSQPATLLSAVPVPFDTNGDLDLKGQETVLRHLKDTGIGGVFIAGTTGEFTALDDDERAVLLSAALGVYGADAVYTHVGAAAARQAERLTMQAVALGARNLAAITPFYLPAGPAALIDYYRRLDAVAGNARIFVYLFAARTGSTVTPDQLAELATSPSVAGAKISGEPTSRNTSGQSRTTSRCTQATTSTSAISSAPAAPVPCPGFPASSRDLSSTSQTRCTGTTTRRPARRRTASNRPSTPSTEPTSRCSRPAWPNRAYRQVPPGWRSTNQHPRSSKPCAPQSRI